MAGGRAITLTPRRLGVPSVAAEREQIVGCPACEELVHLRPPIPRLLHCPKCQGPMLIHWIAVAVQSPPTRRQLCLSTNRD